MIGRRRLLPLAVAPLLGGCGFHPLYAQRDGAPGPAATGLGQISVGLLPDRTGQMLRQALQARFERGAEGVEHRYDLLVNLGFSGDANAIRTDSVPTHLRLIGTANYWLHAQDPTRSTLTSGTARSVDGYNFIDAQYFASDLENEAAQKRIIDALADQITLQLAAWFEKRAPG